MITDRLSLLAALAVIAGAGPLWAPPAMAAPADIGVGARIIDTAGGEVGTVGSVQDDIVVVKTDRHQLAIPRSSFTPTDKGLLFALTREQLNAQADSLFSEPLLAVGAPVFDPKGSFVGTVETFDDSLATLQLSRIAVQLPVSAFARGPKGPVIGETAASLEAKAAAAAPQESDGEPQEEPRPSARPKDVIAE